MIQSQNRSRYIGASDTSFVVGNWETVSFRNWWMTKLGINFKPKFQNKYTLAGTYYEHAILNTVLGCEKDRQVIIPEIGLRVNYDGMVRQAIKEVKTYKEANGFKVSKGYWRQAQVEMFAAESDDLEILAYPLTEEHYRNYFIPIDKEKISSFPVEYDEEFIENEWLPRLMYLKHCRDIGAWPKKEDCEVWQSTKAGELKQLILRLRSNRKSFSVMTAGA